ncbi:glycosyl transferase group 1 [Shewanella baltica OS183]|uniref:glycosyltransferase family 4 protein n=1 Tax=Shewanella baltica TaxID=62322 RepID=UPI0001E10F51|nr:glycosyltransferase family 4 protein [Shewanella baltica]EHQ15716.1 glycosyl transferase group 1 [Shewanella baltica OS183]
MKVLYLVNCSNFFCSHFLPLAISTKNKGHNVIIAAGNNHQQERIENLGFSFVEFDLSRSSKSILTEISTFYSIFKLIKRVEPDLLHMLTIKPILYGCIANKLRFSSSVPKLISSVTGLGSSSLSTNTLDKFLWFLIKYAYKFSFSSDKVSVIFENSDDMEQFVKSKLVQRKRSFLVNGAGVDTKEFSPSLEKADLFSVILVARLLKDKGIREYIEAGKMIKDLNLPIRLLLVGSVDNNNPSSMYNNDIQVAHESGYIEYLGFRVDIADLYKLSHVACLPSYREGLPKSLIEAASCGLPIVTTDVPGCRQLVDNHENGFLVPPRDSNALADCLINLYHNKGLLDDMGKASRRLAEKKFGYDQVLASFFEIYKNVGNSENE